jgi:Family of unknown function (DUF6166)
MELRFTMGTQKKYVARRNVQGDAEVCVQDVQTKECKPLDPGYKYIQHSPTGFAWGYLGSGPAQLAFAILLDHFGMPGPAVLHYQDFKHNVIASLNVNDGWELTSDQISMALDVIRIHRTQSRKEAACCDIT